jgi:hypothetical protein
MFSIIFAWLLLKLVKRNGKVTVDGFYILTPVIADCYLIISVLEFLGSQ